WLGAPIIAARGEGSAGGNASAAKDWCDDPGDTSEYWRGATHNPSNTSPYAADQIAKEEEHFPNLSHNGMRGRCGSSPPSTCTSHLANRRNVSQLTRRAVRGLRGPIGSLCRTARRAVSPKSCNQAVFGNSNNFLPLPTAMKWVSTTV